MPYIKAITKAGNTLIIEKYYSSRWHKKGVERNINLNKTTEAQEKCNLRKAERKLTILLNANFTGGDYHLVLDYSPDNRPPTPRGCPPERTAIHPEAAEDLPEGGRRDKICGSMRVWEKRRPSSPPDPKLPRRDIDKRHPKKMAIRESPFQPDGRQRGVFKACCLHNKKQEVLERMRRKRKTVFPVKKPPCAGDQEEHHPDRGRILRKTKDKKRIPDRPGQ